VLYLDSQHTKGINALFFLALQANGLVSSKIYDQLLYKASSANGVLGLCRDYQSSTYTTGPLLIDQLYNSVSILMLKLF
jgi:hypothetical protein